MEVAVMKRVIKLTLLAAAMLPCSAFFTPPAIARAAPRLGSNSHNRCLISDRPQQHGGVIGLCAAQAALPRRPPPPPPKKAAVGAGGASHLKIKDPQLQAGAWREELGLGKNIASCAVCNRSSHPLLCVLLRVAYACSVRYVSITVLFALSWHGGLLGIAGGKRIACVVRKQLLRSVVDTTLRLPCALRAQSSFDLGGRQRGRR